MLSKAKHLAFIDRFWQFKQFVLARSFTFVQNDKLKAVALVPHNLAYLISLVQLAMLEEFLYF